MNRTKIERGTRKGEKLVWRHYGIEPDELTVEVGADRTRLRIHEFGEGPPVLFVHGTGGYGPYWAPLLKELPGYRCLVLDRPGWGGSDPIEFRGSKPTRVAGRLLADVLTALKIESSHLVGASVGDSWTLAMALDHPEKVRTVSLLGGGPLVDQIEVPRFIKMLRSPLGHLMARAPYTEKMWTAQTRGVGHGPSLDEGRMPRVYIDWHLEMTNRSEWRKHERTMVRVMTDGRVWNEGVTLSSEDLAGITAPVLMFWGTGDPTGSTRIWQEFVDAIPAGELVVLEGAGHLPWFDEPQEVASRLIGHMTA